MASKLDKLRRSLNDEFRNLLARDFHKEFSVEIKSEWAFLADRLITTRCDDKDFAPDETAWIEAYEKGYLAAMSLCRD